MKWPRLSASRASRPALPQQRFAVDRERLFDMDKTRALADLLAIPRGRRDPAWTERFFDAAWNASLVVADPAVITGPDGFPYVRLNLPPPGRFKPTAIANLAAVCLERATGITLFSNPTDRPDAAQYVLPVGMIDSLMRFDTWQGDPLDHQDKDGGADGDALQEGWGQTVTLKETRQILLGSPSVQYLPTYSARALLNHMRGAWQVPDPRVRLMVDPNLRPTRNLVVGRKRGELPPDASWDVHCSRLLWYLPKGRSIVLMPDDWRLEDMTPLEQLAGQAPGPVVG